MDKVVAISDCPPKDWGVAIKSSFKHLGSSCHQCNMYSVYLRFCHWILSYFLWLLHHLDERKVCVCVDGSRKETQGLDYDEPYVPGIILTML